MDGNDNKIIWQGNPITYMKSFRKLDCLLCMKERIAILDAHKKDPKELINSQNELYGSCRHKTKFHRYYHTYTSTNDRTSPERVVVNTNNIIDQNIQQSNLDETLKRVEIYYNCFDHEEFLRKLQYFQ